MEPDPGDDVAAGQGELPTRRSEEPLISCVEAGATLLVPLKAAFAIHPLVMLVNFKGTASLAYV